MTFTKEKLERVRATVDCSTILLAHSGNNQPHPLPEGWHHAYTPMDSDEFRRFVIEAATALPHYITALAEAERALEQINANSSDAGASNNKKGSEWIAAICREISDKALTTIRQLARGKE